jgi:hypothetical protein
MKGDMQNFVGGHLGICNNETGRTRKMFRIESNIS